ncbi:MAG: P-type conjugative transfer protein VirB9 [Wolbachia endosymbiont of Xenopsylla cheopis]
MSFYKVLLSFCLFVSTGISAAIALDRDVPIAVDSRVKTFVYSPNEVFTVVLSHGYHSYIEFDEGELVQTIAMGDSVSWKVRNIGNRLFIMPVESNGKTNMIVITSKRRSYVFDIMCKADLTKQISQNYDFSAERDLSYIVRFYYPKNENEFDYDKPTATTPVEMHYSEEKLDKIIETNNTKLNYIYNAGQNSDDIVPSELFDDGSLTYFKFKDDNIPKIFIKDKKGNEMPCKMLSFNDYIVIKGVHKRLLMRYKSKYVEVVNNS